MISGECCNIHARNTWSGILKVDDCDAVTIIHNQITRVIVTVNGERGSTVD
jgi:folate-binding Fe-S cluster repair protein YgfZ